MDLKSVCLCSFPHHSHSHRKGVHQLLQHQQQQQPLQMFLPPVVAVKASSQLHSSESSLPKVILTPSLKLQHHHHQHQHQQKNKNNTENGREYIAEGAAIMLECLKEGRTEDAWCLFEEVALKKKKTTTMAAAATATVRNNGAVAVAVDGVCLSRLVCQLCYKGSPWSVSRAQKVLAWLQERGQVELLDGNALGLLAMAASKAGSPRYAASIIRSMLAKGLFPHVKAWSAVISQLSKTREDAHLAVELFDEVRSRLEVEEDRASLVVGKMTTTRADTGAFNAALNACATAGLADRAESLLDEMLASPTLHPDAFSFNILIKLYAAVEQKHRIAGVLDRMQKSGTEPHPSTMHCLVAAFVGLDDITTAERVIKSLRDGGGINEIIRLLSSKDPKSSVIRTSEAVLTKEEESESEYESSGGVSVIKEEELESESKSSGIFSITKESESESESQSLSGVSVTKEEELESESESSGNVFVAVKKVPKRKKFGPDTRMYTILMKGYMRKGRFRDVMQLLIAMQNEKDPACKPNEVTYTTAISACMKLRLLDEAHFVLDEMVAENVPANVVTYNILLNGYCKAGQIVKAKALVADMVRDGTPLDVTSYNTLIDGCISAKDNAGAMEFFRAMREAGIAPSKVSYATLMKAFARNGQPQLVRKVFEEMKQDPRVTLDVVTWNTLIDSYSRAGMAESAKKAFMEMKESRLQPTVSTYSCLVKGFALAGKPGEALVLWNEIRERLESEEHGSVQKLRPDAGLLDSLVNICVRAGFFQRAMEIVACMEKHNIPADKIKYKRLFVDLHSKIYTSKHTSQSRIERTEDRRRAVEAFKFWVGLPNQYYNYDW